jgi:hypothetical protein
MATIHFTSILIRERAHQSREPQESKIDAQKAHAHALFTLKLLSSAPGTLSLLLSCIPKSEHTHSIPSPQHKRALSLASSAADTKIHTLCTRVKLRGTYEFCVTLSAAILKPHLALLQGSVSVPCVAHLYSETERKFHVKIIILLWVEINFFFALKLLYLSDQALNSLIFISMTATFCRENFVICIRA